MHIEYENEDSFKIYIFDRNKIKKIGEKENNEIFFKPLFLLLKNKYHMKLNGLYKINAFTLNYYGIILEVSHEKDELYDIAKGLGEKKNWGGGF